MNATPLNLKPDSTVEPTIKLASQIIKNAVTLKADGIILELDMNLHLKINEEMEAIREDKSLTVDKKFFKMGQLPNAFGIIYLTNGVQDRLPSANGELFGNVTKILLLAAGVPYWTKDEISAPFETINPASKWILQSKDLTRRVEIQRI